VQPANLV